jgi:hypothetical protein
MIIKRGIIRLTNLAFKYKIGISNNEHMRDPIKPRIKNGIDIFFGKSPELLINTRK